MFCVSDLAAKPFLIRRVLAAGFQGVFPEHRTTILDSGGYQVLKTGRFVMPLGELTALCQRAKPSLVISLDRPIVGELRPGAAKRIVDQNVCAYANMVRKLGSSMVVPVVHGQELELVANQCERYAAEASPPMVCLGGNVPFFKGLTRNSR